GSCMSTTLLQLAGAWSEWPRRGKLPSPAPWQFATSQLLKLTLGAALILTLLKLTGRLNAWAAIWTTLWVFYQAVSMWGVLRLLGWLYRGKAVLEGGGGDRGGMWG